MRAVVHVCMRACVRAFNKHAAVLLVTSSVSKCLQVDRVIAKRTRLGQPQYLVKWRGLGYAEVTWEPARALEVEADQASSSFLVPFSIAF